MLTLITDNCIPDVYVNDVRQALNFSGSGQAFNGVIVNENGGTVSVAFTSSGVSLQVRTAANLTYVTVVVPPAFKGLVSG